MSTEKLPYIKYGQAQGYRSNRHWVLFKDLPELCEMGLFKNIIAYREQEERLEFVITAENSRKERVEIGRADCITVTAALIDWILGCEQDEETYEDIDGSFLGKVITGEQHV